jgi:hypothetical protein
MELPAVAAKNIVSFEGMVYKVGDVGAAGNAVTEAVMVYISGC